ncbi:MAG: ABC transporter ATP-binding protein [Methylomonas sp.]|jgi:ABC-2 type transport system ATP-binding protein
MNALSIKQLKKTYKNGFTALKGIDLEVESGDFFALLGPNGAGKSTLIGIVSSLVTKTSGSVSVFGHDLDKHNEQVKTCIGLVPQEINFNQFETVENVVLIQAGYYGIRKKIAKQRVEQCLRQMDLWEKRHTVSRTLSGGMKRRLMIARAMAHEPRLLILDEPTAGVDIEIRRSMWQMMRDVNAQGVTIILTTHYLEEAESLCKHIAIIDDGRIIKNSDMHGFLNSIKIEHFVLDTVAPLAAAPVIDGYQIELAGRQALNVAVPKQLGLNRLFAGLSRQGIEISSLKNKSNRLEQLFLDLTR